MGLQLGKCYATIEDMKNDVIKVMNLSNEHLFEYNTIVESKKHIFVSFFGILCIHHCVLKNFNANVGV